MNALHMRLGRDKSRLHAEAERSADDWMTPGLLRSLRREFLLKARNAKGQAYPMRDPYRRIAADYRNKLKNFQTGKAN